jgi:hypothetical protein
VASVSPEEAAIVAGSVSWLRAYSMPCSIRAMRSAVRDGTLDRDDARRLLTDGRVVDGDDQFWDVQALRRSHVVRIVSASSIDCRRPGSRDWVPVEVHLVLHEAGLALIRLTIDPISGGAVGIPELASYSDAVWHNKCMTWRVRLAGEQWELDADVRRAMDAVMLPMHERFCGREPNLSELRLLETPEERYRWLEERVEAGESLSAYPQTFGTAYELVLDRPIEEQLSPRPVVELAYGDNVDPRDSTLERPAETGHNHDWFIGENRAVLVLGGARDRNTIGTFDALRTQTLEYLTLQRGALRFVQRATQLSITERRTISRVQLQQWQRLVAALTDEYVLHDQIATTLRPLLKEMKENRLLRDPATLEAQVHQNLGTFLEVLDAASHRVAIILSGLFGVVAAITLAPMARDLELTVFKTGGSVSSFDNRHLVLSIAIDVLLLVFVALTSAILIVRANRLRWPGR